VTGQPAGRRWLSLQLDLPRHRQPRHQRLRQARRFLPTVIVLSHGTLVSRQSACPRAQVCPGGQLHQQLQHRQSRETMWPGRQATLPERALAGIAGTATSRVTTPIRAQSPRGPRKALLPAPSTNRAPSTQEGRGLRMSPLTPLQPQKSGWSSPLVEQATGLH
jgi:hypothetical protein